MNKNDIVDQLIELTDLIQHQTNSLASYQSRIPQIEIDITMSNIRKCYEYFHKLNLVNQSSVLQNHLKSSLETIQNEPSPASSFSNNEPPFAFIEKQQEPEITTSAPESETHAIEPITESVNQPIIIQDEPHFNPIPVKEVITTEQPIFEKTVENTPTPTSTEVFTYAEPKEVTPEPILPVSSPAIEPKVEDEKPLFTAEKVIIPEPVFVEAPKPANNNTNTIITGDLFADPTPTIGESIKPDRPSLAEKFQDTTELKTLEKKISKKPLKDIKEAIGINDKFLLINELFKGNQHHYNQALQFFNMADGYDEANGMFTRMKSELGWKEDAKATQILADLIQRRHPEI